jgi:hypothetical protein
MTQEHPITPPPELVQQWVDTYFGGRISQSNFHVDLATRAAQWGADQELEACCEWLQDPDLNVDTYKLCAARRPKPHSLKEQALEIVRGTPVNSAGLYSYEHVEIIRRALEQLDD